MIMVMIIMVMVMSVVIMIMISLMIIGSRHFGPRGPTVRGPTVCFEKVDSWAQLSTLKKSGANCPGLNCLGPKMEILPGLYFAKL